MDKDKPLGEESLIEMVQRGSPHAAAGAWEQLLRLHSSHLFAHLAKRGFVAAEQEDIVSETWLRAWRKIGQYKFEKDIGFFPWLRAIANFVAKEHFKKRYTNPLEKAEDVQDAEESLSDARKFEMDLLQRLSQSEFREAVEEALRQAPADYQKVVEAKFFCGFEPQEIAELYGWPTNKVYSTTFRAVDWLKRTLAERFGVEGPEHWYV